jgi:hypothetical protein
MQQFEEELAALEEQLAESQDSPQDGGPDGDNTQMTESRRGDGEGDQQVRLGCLVAGLRFAESSPKSGPFFDDLRAMR